MKASAQPNPKIEAPPRKPVVYGRAILLEGTGKEVYQVFLVETENGVVVSRKPLELGRDGVGASLPVAFGAVNQALIGPFREASDLWQRSLSQS